MKLTAKQEAFCQAIASGKTQTDAYRIAYGQGRMKDTTIWSKASRLIDKDKVRARIEQLKLELAKKDLWTREMSVKGLITAYSISNKHKNANGMINSVKELNAMHGFNAPQKLDISGTISNKTLDDFYKDIDVQSKS